MKVYEAIICKANDGGTGPHYALTIIANYDDEALIHYHHWMQNNPNFDEISEPQAYADHVVIIGPRQLYGQVEPDDRGKNWSVEDQLAAIYEGWAIEGDENELFICRYEDTNVFLRDADAYEWVATLAEQGSELHNKALRLAEDLNHPFYDFHQDIEPSNWKYNAGYQSAAGYHD